MTNYIVLPIAFTVVSAMYVGVALIDQKAKASDKRQAQIECATEATDAACELAYGFDMYGDK